MNPAHWRVARQAYFLFHSLSFSSMACLALHTNAARRNSLVRTRLHRFLCFRANELYSCIDWHQSSRAHWLTDYHGEIFFPPLRPILKSTTGGRPSAGLVSKSFQGMEKRNETDETI